MSIIEQIKSGDVRVVGNGTRGGEGNLRAEQSGVIHYAPEEVYITVHAATPMAEVEATLAEKNQILPFEPMDHRVILGTKGEPTVGGALGVNVDGPRRLHYGSMREAVLGLKVVDGQGQELRTGGVVMKNVTGLDLTKFFTGSRGRLGLATEVTLRVLPQPREVVTLAFAIPPSEVMAKMLPLLRQPLDIEAAHYRSGTLYLRLAGAFLDNAQARVLNAIGEGEVVDNAIWERLRNWFALAEYPEIWRLFLRPSQTAKIIPTLNLPYVSAIGGQQLIVAGERDEIAPLCNDGIFAICEKGAILGERMPERSAAETSIREKLIAVFDPNGKFTPTTEAVS